MRVDPFVNSKRPESRPVPCLQDNLLVFAARPRMSPIAVQKIGLDAQLNDDTRLEAVPFGIAGPFADSINTGEVEAGARRCRAGRAGDRLRRPGCGSARRRWRGKSRCQQR